MNKNFHSNNANSSILTTQPLEKHIKVFIYLTYLINVNNLIKKKLHYDCRIIFIVETSNIERLFDPETH